MEEISLREIIQVILKGKLVIAIFTAFCILISGIASYFIISPQYEAHTMLMISPVNASEEEKLNINSINGIVSSMSQYPKMTLDTYKEQIKAYSVLEYVRSTAGLDELSLKSVENKIDVESIENTNIITITATDNDPRKASQIANITARKFSEFVTETNQKQAKKSAEFIKFEQDKEKENMDILHEDLKNFLAQPAGPDELRQELNSKLSQLTGFKTRLVQLQLNEKVTLAALDKTRNLFENTPKYIELEKLLMENDILSGVISDTTGADTIDLAGINIIEQQVNEAYTLLLNKLNEYEIQAVTITSEKNNIDYEIKNIRNEIEKIQAELAEKQKTYDELQHRYNLAKQTYDAYRQKYKEAFIKQSIEIGNQSIVVISEALPPDAPASPNKMMNIAIAAVLDI
jgi:polysaccharide biosynthesis transport protein